MPVYTFNQSVRMLIIYVHLYLLLSVKMLWAAANRKVIISHNKKTQKVGHPQGQTIPQLNCVINKIVSFLLSSVPSWACRLCTAPASLGMQDDFCRQRCLIQDITDFRWQNRPPLPPMSSFFYKSVNLRSLLSGLTSLARIGSYASA